MTSTPADQLDALAKRALQPVVLRSRKGWARLHLKEIWQYRDLLAVLTRRDITVKYKQTVLGVAWAVIRPVLSMVVITLVIGNFLGAKSKIDSAAPYPVYVFSGVLLWSLFASTLSQSTNSLLSNAGMLRKVYFPRLIAPLSCVGTPVADFLIGFVILLGIMGWYSFQGAAVHFTWQLLLVPAFMLSALLAAQSVGILLAGYTVRYRDIVHGMPFLIQIWFYTTPIMYGPQVFPESFRWLLQYNPVAGTVLGFRNAVLGSPIDYGQWAWSVGCTVPILLIALEVFARMERRFVDIV